MRISTYRNQAVLKRLQATPLPVWKFFAGEVAAHLLLALVQALIILAVGVFVFGADIHGNLGWVLLIVLLGTVVFLNIGFILSAWARSPRRRLRDGQRRGAPIDVPGRHLFLHGLAAVAAALRRDGPAPHAHAGRPAGRGDQQRAALGDLAPPRGPRRLGRGHRPYRSPRVPVPVAFAEQAGKGQAIQL